MFRGTKCVRCRGNCVTVCWAFVDRQLLREELPLLPGDTGDVNDPDLCERTWEFFLGLFHEAIFKVPNQQANSEKRTQCGN